MASVKEPDSCTICLDPLVVDVADEGSKPVAQKCDHVFHQHCITQWLALKNSCPNCRVELREGLEVSLVPVMTEA